MSQKRRTFTRDFKHEAVRLVESSQKPVTVIARDLGIDHSVLRSWVLKFKQHPEDAFPGKGHRHADDEELVRLHREVAILREERDILKKALAIFSREPK